MEIAVVAKAETILGWYRKLIARKDRGIRVSMASGPPRVDAELENLIVRMAKENSS